MKLLKEISMKNAFTLIEMLVVVTVIGIITAFAIPSYRKALDRAEERQVRLNLQLIAGAQEAYKARYDEYWPPVGVGNQGLAALNSALKLSIVQDPKFVFTCGGSSSLDFQCFAASGFPLKWQLFTNVGIATDPTNYPDQVACDKNYPANECPTYPFYP